MVALKVSKFGGISPRTSARYLPEDRSQTALNVDTTRRGPLQPTYSYGSPLYTLGIDPKTLFRYNEDYTVEDGTWWMASVNDVDFCRGQIIGDDYEVVYFTDNDDNFLVPQFTYNEFVTPSGGGSLHGTLHGASNSYNLGVPKPTLAPVASITPPSETDGLTVEYRTYVYTYVWAKAGRTMESAPSPAAANIVEFYIESDSVITIDTLTTGAPDVGMASVEVTKRIYRSIAGTFLLVDEIPVTQQTFVDNVEANVLGEQIASITWDVPPPGLKGLTNMANGIVAGFVGRDVYFCEPYVPHAWPINYALTVNSPIIGMAAVDTTLVVLTNERPYFIQGSTPALMTVVEGDIEQGCVSKRSIEVLNGKVYYTSPDGLVSVSPRGSVIETEAMFTYKQWNDLLDPSSVYGYSHDLKYYGFHSTGAIIIDVPSGQTVTLDLTGVTAAFADLRLDKLYIVDDANSIVAWGDGAASEYTWKSKKFSLPREVSFGFMQVEAESYPLDFEVFADGASLHSGTVTSRVMFRLPSILARDWEIELVGDKEVFNVVLAQSGEEIASA